MKALHLDGKDKMVLGFLIKKHLRKVKIFCQGIKNVIQHSVINNCAILFSPFMHHQKLKKILQKTSQFDQAITT